MSNSASDRTPREQQLDAIIAEYYQAAEQGEPQDQAELLRRHPGFSAELQEFFTDVGQVEKVAQPLIPVLDDTQPVSASSPNSLTPGNVVRYFGDYEILEQLGEGGMGVVYKARQQKLKRIVALKMIKVGEFAQNAEIQRFQAETRAAARLNHPGIVAIHEVGVYARQHFFTMEYVGGGSLARLHRDEPVAARRAAELVRQLAEAVHFAHEQGIIHRDLKPANILLTTNGTPRITDFGLAKQLWAEDATEAISMTETGQILGTAGYMAPEQAAGKNRLVGPPADIYALGAILYALVTGRAPFVGESQADTIMQVLDRAPVSPRVLNASIPRDLETICLKCLEKEPHKRYGTAQLLAKDLGRLLEGRPVLARPVSPWDHAWRWCRRNPVNAGLATGLVMAMVVGTCISAWFAIVADSRATEATINATSARDEKTRADRERDGAKFAEIAAKAAKQIAELERDIAGRRLYVSDLRLAEQALEGNDLFKMQRLLEGQQPVGGVDRRGWEWFYLRSRAYRHELSFDRHQRCITSIAWRPDRQRIASASSDGTVYIWDPMTGEVDSTFAIPVKDPCRLVWNSAGDRLLTLPWRIYAIGGIKSLMGHIWNPKTGAIELAFIGRYAAWSPDGRKLLLLSDKDHSGSRPWVMNEAVGSRIVNLTRFAEVQVWDVQTKELTEVPNWRDRVAAAAWSPDGTMMALADQAGLVHLVRVDTGKSEATLRGHSVSPTLVTFCPAGMQLATASPDGTIRTWNAATGAQIHSWKARNPYHVQLDWSADHKWLSIFGVDSSQSSKNDSVKVFDTASGSTVLDERAVNLAWSSDGTSLAMLLPDSSVGTWDASTWNRERTIVGHTTTPSEIVWSPDNDRLATGGSDVTVKTWNLAANLVSDFVAIETMRNSPIAWHPSGKIFAIVGADRTIKVVDTATRRPVISLTGHKTAAAINLAWNPAGTHLVSCANTYVSKGEVKIWHVDRQIDEHTIEGADFSAVHWSSDGSRVFMLTQSYPKDAKLRIFDTRRGLELAPSPVESMGSIRSIAWTPNGRLYAHTLNPDFEEVTPTGKTIHKDPAKVGVVVVRAMETDEELFRVTAPSLVNNIQFDSQSKRLAVSHQNPSRYNNQVTIWDLQTKASICTVDAIGSILAFHPTEDRLITGDGGQFTLWDLASGQELLTLGAGEESIANAAWHPDGKLLAAAGSKLLFWDAEQGYEHAEPLISDYFRKSGFSISIGGMSFRRGDAGR